MKKIIFLVLFSNINSIAQNIEYSIIKNVKQRGQVGGSTCWAANLEMLESAFGKNDNLQLALINKALKRTRNKYTYRTITKSAADSVGTMTEDSLKAYLKRNYKSFDVIKNSNPENPSLEFNWKKVKANFRKKDTSPMLIFNYYDIYSAHYRLAIGYLELENKDKTSSKYLLINDPWVKNEDSVGIQYALNFDSFLAPSAFSKSTFFIYNIMPKTGFVNQIDSSQYTLGDFKSSRGAKKWYESKKKASNNYAFKNISGFDNVKMSPIIAKFINVSPGDSSKINEPLAVRRIKEEDFDDFSKFRAMLQSGPTNYYFGAVQKNDTSFVFVTKLDGQSSKYVPMTERLEPFKSSITKVVSNIETNFAKENSVAQNSQTITNSSLKSSFISVPNMKSILFQDIDFKNILYFSPQSRKPDFLLIPNKSKADFSFILVDLFNKIKDKNQKEILPKISGFDIPIKLGSFNYSLYKLDKDNFKSLQEFLVTFN
jgi:hypothetical protein